MIKTDFNIKEQWNFYFRNETGTLFNECETWNVVSFINKRYTFGKSLRYSDRFYRNWAIRKAKEDEKRFAAGREEYASRASIQGRGW